LVLQQKEHDVFRRDGDDLIMEKKIPLVEALCGTKFTVPHLDGRTLVVTSKPGEVIRPGSVKFIENEGMPRHRDPFTKGKLLIKFEIEFPQDGSLNDKAIKVMCL